jgi:hypothetical protein
METQNKWYWRDQQRNMVKMKTSIQINNKDWQKKQNRQRNIHFHVQEIVNIWQNWELMTLED